MSKQTVKAIIKKVRKKKQRSDYYKTKHRHTAIVANSVIHVCGTFLCFFIYFG